MVEHGLLFLAVLGFLGACISLYRAHLKLAALIEDISRYRDMLRILVTEYQTFLGLARKKDRRDCEQRPVNKDQ